MIPLNPKNKEYKLPVIKRISLKKLLFLLCSCIGTFLISAQNPVEDLTKFVDPLIGTKEMGHEFPDTCVPVKISILQQSDIAKGDELIFEMSNRPNKKGF